MSPRSLMPWQRGGSSLPSRTSPFSALQDEMNRMFSNFSAGLGMEPFGKMGERFDSFSPSVDIDENDNEIVVSAELPGLDEKDVDITLTRDYLTIRGEKKTEQEKKEGKDGCYYERSYGMFERTIPLMNEIEEDKVDAQFKKGVLTIKLPKSADAKKSRKKISVRT